MFTSISPPFDKKITWLGWIDFKIESWIASPTRNFRLLLFFVVAIMWLDELFSSKNIIPLTLIPGMIPLWIFGGMAELFFSKAVLDWIEFSISSSL